jgi:hypothetical protein
LNHEKLARVGSIVIAWAMVEYAMERIIWGLTGLHDGHGRIMTSGMQWRVKEGVIRELIDGRKDEIAKSLRYSLNALPGMAPTRNHLAHGIWTWDKASGDLVITATREKPRRKGEFKVRSMSNLILDDLIQTLTEVQKELMGLADQLGSVDIYRQAMTAAAIEMAAA